MAFRVDFYLRQQDEKSDTPGRAGGLMSRVASKAVALLTWFFVNFCYAADLLKPPLLVCTILVSNVCSYLLKFESYC
jgi:hypothetical protein